MTHLTEALTKKIMEQAPELYATLTQSEGTPVTLNVSPQSTQLALSRDEAATLRLALQQQRPHNLEWIKTLHHVEQIHHNLNSLCARLHTDVTVEDQQGRRATLSLRPEMILAMHLHVNCEDDEQCIHTGGAHFYCEQLDIKLDASLLRKQCPSLFNAQNNNPTHDTNNDPQLTQYLQHLERTVSLHVQRNVDIKWEHFYYTYVISQQQLTLANSAIPLDNLPPFRNPYLS